MERGVARALLEIAHGDINAAVATCRSVASSSALAQHLTSYLSGPGAEDVYTSPEAFERFISGGSNAALYESTEAALDAQLRPSAPRSLLDIGCGDGRVTAATVPPSCRQVHLVEPSAVMLRTATQRLSGQVADVVATCSSVQELLDDQPGLCWDAAQATFALHNLQPQDRRAALALLAERVGSLTIVEFDVPDFADGSPEHADFAASAYEVGVAEYAEDQVVIDGFLLPVLVGQFALDRQRHTFEQSASSWVRDLADAGFDFIASSHVFSFWWADAVMFAAAGQNSLSSSDVMPRSSS